MSTESQTPPPAAPTPTLPFSNTDALDLLEREAAGMLAADGDASSSQPGTAQPAAPDFDNEAQMLVSFGLDMIALAVGQGTRVQISYDTKTKADGAKALAPVLAKHNGAMPAWLRPYQQEFRFGMWFAGVAFQTYLQVQAAKAQPPPSTPAADGGA
ncbi:hypothetical protein C3942_16860 [Solimonas fluminis]|uniref:Uncharacterized protein n=1 Tax=Solimonas fluminis TaxID=2086571 RepID=A0A2S5TCJ2_9GAMM|nr:hypothetical protein [Solimonas fluminis]PPE72719.1 hypothetical protein C3942_16860 [Solimonas fluminis]